MKKAAIIYASVHHGNTEKVVTAMAHDMPVTLFKAEQAQNVDFSEYDCVGFASGIYAGRFHKSIYTVLGEFECKGFDTFGPFKLFGGLGKGHPDDKELADGVDFIKKIMLTSI